MILAWLILIPMAAGLVATTAGARRPLLSRWVALAAMAVDLAIAVGLWANSGQPVRFEAAWIPAIGASFSLYLDGLSLLLVLLTSVMGLLAVLASWRGIAHRVGLFHFYLLGLLAGVMGIFLARDLLLFYAFWEVMLVPLYFLIAIWGGPRRARASIKLFLFTQLGGLFMLLAILGLYFVHGQVDGDYTFNYDRLLNTPMAESTAFALMLGFFAAFAVKLPAVPVHTWLTDAHEQSPISGGVDLTGLVIKVGAYGLLRYVVGLFPEAALGHFATFAMVLGVVGILYGGVLAFSQSDLKRLVAYSSISHMGFVLLGVFAWNTLALQGVVMLLLASGIATGSLFILIGMIHDRTGQRNLAQLGGLWDMLPRTGGLFLFFALAAMGLPMLMGFVGEILVLVGTFGVSPTFAILATGGLIVSVIYALWVVQAVFQGPRAAKLSAPVRDVSPREWAMLGATVVITVWLGLFPMCVLCTSAPALRSIQKTAPANPLPTGSVRAELRVQQGGQP